MKMPFLRVSTREIVDDRTYPSALAQSVHFAVSVDGAAFEPLNHNYGVLYAEAEISAENTILERGVLHPALIRANGWIYVLADFVDAVGALLQPESVCLWKTRDCSVFEPLGLVPRASLPFDPAASGDTLAITLPELSALVQRYSKLRFSHILLPERVEISDVAELSAIRAEVVYSDGSSDWKPIRWDTSALRSPGEYTVRGEVQQQKFPYPSACGFADPVIFPWEGKWYYIATNDNTNDVGMYVRGADTVEGLFAPDNEPSVILPYDEERGFIQTFWAPEFHVIGGELYILFAVGGRKWSPHAHMMRLRRGGSILNPDDWEEPLRVIRRDGDDLAQGGITLDMTFFRLSGRAFLCWSQRWYNPDTGSMLYIAEIDESRPWQLLSEPVLLSRPLYGWENQSGTINNEGPYPLFVGDRLYLSYSGGAAGGYSYVVGYLMIENGQNPLDPASWTKTSCPVSSSVMFSDREGPAHCSFFVGEDGKTYFACHAQPVGQDNQRNTSITRLHFDASGWPVLGLEPEEDLPEACRRVSMKVVVRG